jgi:hypothetical protein
VRTATATRELLAPRDDVWETVGVALNPPGSLELRFERSGYRARPALEATGAQRTTATLTIELENPQETLAERLEEVVALAVTGPSDGFAQSIVERLYELCQTGAET